MPNQPTGRMIMRKLKKSTYKGWLPILDRWPDDSENISNLRNRRNLVDYFLPALNPICFRGGVGSSVSFFSSSNTTLKYLLCVEA